MNNQKDKILRYGFLLGKRYTNKQRLKFLRAAQIEFDQMGYKTEVTSADWEFAASKKYFYNLYAGDLERADTVFMTYYDTPVKSFPFSKSYAFKADSSRMRLFLNLIPSLLIFAFALATSYSIILPRMLENGWLSVWGAIFLMLVFVSLFLIHCYRNGIPKRLNLVRNSSSILAIFALAEKMVEKKNIAFAFVDGGTTTRYGTMMAHEFFSKKSARFVYIDAIGNEGDLHWFSNIEITEVEGRLHHLEGDQKGLADILVTSGFEKNGYVIIKENKTLDEKKLLSVVNELEKIS